MEISLFNVFGFRFLKTMSPFFMRSASCVFWKMLLAASWWLCRCLILCLLTMDAACGSKWTLIGLEKKRGIESFDIWCESSFVNLSFPPQLPQIHKCWVRLVVVMLLNQDSDVLWINSSELVQISEIDVFQCPKYQNDKTWIDES